MNSGAFFFPICLYAHIFIFCDFFGKFRQFAFNGRTASRVVMTLGGLLFKRFFLRVSRYFTGNLSGFNGFFTVFTFADADCINGAAVLRRYAEVDKFMCARREKLEAGSKQSVQGKGKKEGKPYFAACFPRKHKTINKKLLSMNPLSMLGVIV